MKKSCLFLAIILTLTLKVYPQKNVIKFDEKWKFIPGDNIDYAKPSFDDSQWKLIGVDKMWEDQGYPDLDGFAWYRVKVFIPSSLKEKAYLKDTLEICLGKIDDFDESFINGQIFGINGKNVPASEKIDTLFYDPSLTYWDLERVYKLPVNDPRIKWDAENVFAIRVYDRGGLGGIFSGDQSIHMVNISEYLTLNYNQVDFHYKNGSISKSLKLGNSSSVLALKGKFSIEAVNKLNGKIAYHKSYKVDLKPSGLKEIDFTLLKQDHSNYITYKFYFTESGDSILFREESPYILTPTAELKPKINGARIYGERIGKPFLFLVAASGSRPMTFTAEKLPAGLTINKESGIITGVVNSKGNYDVKITAKNKYGEAQRDLKIVIGDEVALTPPMGWNSWNCWGLSVTQNKVLSSAREFVVKKLSQHGWTYVNIDDGWEIVGNSTLPKRDAVGNILVNNKFQSMKALGDSIHALGLKFGIYSSPGPLTCGGYTASYGHELQDAKSYASWGIDYLKYDWCSYDNIARDHSLPELKKPYLVMRDALNKVDRDIVFSLCQYGMGNVWEWGAEVGGNLWRTTGDITDNWQSLSEIGFSQVEDAKYAGPGHWNDPDMLIVGWVGWGPSLHPTGLTPDEQYTHISLWNLLSAPMLLGCDLEKLDDFTLNLLTNDEVIALDQDPLGKQAVPVIKKDSIQVWEKQLSDGNIALGIFNLDSKSKKFDLNLNDLGIKKEVLLRDLWKQKDIGKFHNDFSTLVASHGVVLLKVFIK
jgi:alpha-galactosidase